MDERNANIDLLFRNGLKDLEMLPPCEVWNNIQPVIRERQRPYILFRTAAAVTVLVSVGLLTYRWGSEIAPAQESMVFPVQEESYAPGSAPVLVAVADFTRERETVIPDVSDSPARSHPAINKIYIDDELPGFYTPETTGRDNLISENSGTNTPDIERVDFLQPDIYNNQFTNPANKIEQKTPGRRWSVSALFSPTYYNRMSSGNNEAIAEILASDQSVSSYSGGLSFSFKLNKRLTLSSGLYYAAIGNELQGVSVYSGFSDHISTKGTGNFGLETVNGTITTQNADVFLSDNSSGDRIITRYTKDVFDPIKSNLEFIDDALRQSSSYIELPVMLKYKVIDKGIDLNLIGGLSSNLLVYNAAFAGENGARYEVGDTEDLNNITFSSLIGMGMEYNISQSLSINLEPTLRYYLNPFSEIPGIRVHPYSIGVFSGLTYRF